MGSWGVGRGKTTLTAPVWPHTQFISTLSTLGIDLSGSSWGLSLPPLPTRGPGHPGTPKRGLYLRAASNKNDGRDEEQPANGIVRVACEVGERRESNLGRDMDGAGNHYPQQTNTGIENQIQQVLTNKWELNIKYIWTRRREQQTLRPSEG